MRTKHILTALAIPALFAACVADDFESSVTNGVEAKRAELSEGFKLNFEDPATRFDAGELGNLRFTYEAGDTIGGAIIDEYSIDNGVPKFEVVNYVSTNHPFVRDAAGEWNINHTMVEGNYLFYFPYNENNHARTAAQYSIPVLQDLSDENGEFSATAAVEKYNMSVGSQFLSRNDLNAHLQLVNIYGYLRLKVTIDNHYAGGYVDKVVLMADNNQFKLNGQISNTKVSELFKNLEKSTQDYQTALDGMTTTAAFALDDDDMYYQEELNQTSSVMVAQAPEGTALVADAQNNKTFETYLVIPAANYTDVKVYIYTTDGHVYVDEDVDVTGTTTTGGQDFDVVRNGIKRVEVSVKEAEVVPYVVTSEADWNNYVDMLPKNSKNQFIIAGDNFSITNKTKYPTNGAVINVSGDLKVTGNNVTMKNVNASKVIVEKGAKLTTDGTFAAEEVENNGTLVFAPVYDDEDEVVIYGDDADEGVELVNNMAGATLEIQAEGIAQFKLNNQIDATSSALPHGSVAVNGTLILNAGSENSGKVEIAAAGSLRGQFTNNKKVTYPKNVQDEDLITNRFTPTITNNGEIYVNNGTVTNNGTIVSNKGSEISCERSGYNQFINAGLIELEDGADLLISSNAKGEIKLSELDQTGWSVESGLGVVSYETKAADLNRSYDFSKTGTGITKLYVTGTLGITNYGDNLNDVEVTRTGTLTLPASTPTAPATLEGSLTVKDGATVTVASTNAVIATLVVEEGGRLNINANNAMTTTTVENYGRVYVGGTFTTAMTEAEAGYYGGEFRNTIGGDTGNIKFGQSEDEKKKAAFEAAMANLVGAYANNSSEITSGRIDSWNDLTRDNILAAGWDGNADWTKAAKEAVVEAYNAWTGETYTESLNDLLKKDDNFSVTVFNTGKTAAKAEADAALKEGFAQLTPTTWLGSVVYTKASATADILNGTTKLVEGFQAYVRSDAYANTLNVAGSRALYLSAKEYVGDANDVPEYSYICTYAGAEEYEVMEALYKLKTQPEYTELVEKIAGLSDLQLNALDGVKSSMRLIYSAYSGNTLNAMDKLDIEKLGLDDYWESVIYDWNYTNESIAALRALFN